MIYTKKFLIFIGALLIFNLSAPAQSRGVNVESVSKLPSKEKRWALIVGVNNYGLKGAANDAQALKSTLVKYAGFPENQIILLTTDSSDADLQPTRKNIIESLDKLTRYVEKDGLFLFAFSGHGKTIDNNAYLIPSDGRMTDNPKLLRDLSIDVTRIKEAIGEMKIKQVLMILDACRDKIIVDNVKGSLSEPQTGVYNRGFSFDVANKEVDAFVTLYATKEGDFAYEYFDRETNQWRGFFSRAIEEGLAGKAAGENGAVTLGRLVEYLERTVPDRVYKEESRRQIPWKTGNGYKESELVLAIAANSEIPVKKPNNADALAQKALLRLKSAELEEAAQLTTEALSLDPRQALALAVRGHARIWLPNKKEYGQSAEDDLQEAVRIEPTNGIYRAWFSNFPPQENEKKEVLKLLVNPKNSLEYYALGINHIWFDGDESPFDKAISLEPKFTMAYFERGMLFADGPNDAQKAFGDMTKVIESLPKDNVVKGIAFYIRASMGNNLKKNSSSVIDDLSRAIQILGNYNGNRYLIGAYEERAATYFNLRRFDDAVNDYTVLITLNKEVSASYYHKRGEVYFAKGDYQKVISDCTQAINISSDEKNGQGVYSGFYALRADAYEKLGDRTRAAIDRQKAGEIKKSAIGATSGTGNTQTLPITRGKKSNKVLFIFSATSGNKISSSDIFSIDAGLSGLVISKLQEKGLTVLGYNNTDLSKDEQSQYLGGINSRADEKALRLLPVALIVSLNVDVLEDMPQYQGLYVAKVDGSVQIIDTGNNQTMKVERFDAVRGFGNTQEQARKNALRAVAENISDSFLNTVKEKAR
jgi:tetratricopeptide (TPR) repeat protein